MNGFVDSVVKKLPSIFHHQLDKFEKASNVGSTCHILTRIQGLVDMVKEACETMGFLSPALSWRDTAHQKKFLNYASYVNPCVMLKSHGIVRYDAEPEQKPIKN
ncbi:hypothetical protein CR513_45482, partial [Mucuna pruriens]